MPLRSAPSGVLLAIVLAALLPASGQTPAVSGNTYTYGVEWRFVRAGEVQLQATSDHQIKLRLRSMGLVSTLFKVDDSFTSQYDTGLCTTAIQEEIHEGRRNREVKVTFDKARKRANYLEKDLTTNATVVSKEIEIPACVHDVPVGLLRLRQMQPAVGTSVELPTSDGKKVVMARVEAQAKETVKTPAGEFQTVRYEAFLFNGVLYGRKGRLYVWLSDDERRIPVQVRVQLPFYVGTITLQLEKIQ